MLSNEQKQEFYEQGYLKIPGAVPPSMVDEARKAMNYSIGAVGQTGEDAEAFKVGGVLSRVARRATDDGSVQPHGRDGCRGVSGR